MKKTLLLALLLPALAAGQGVRPPQTFSPAWAGFNPFGGSGSVLALYLPLAYTGPLLAEDAGTTLHVYWDGSALIDTKGNAWTENGTVPQVAANVSPFVPGKAGAGPYSLANNYQGPTTVGEWTGDWNVTVVWKQTGSGANNQTLLSKINTGYTAGWAVLVNATAGLLRLYVYDGAAKQSTTSAVTYNGINVVTVGKSGGTCYARLNGGSAAATACGTMTAATAEPIRIGRPTAALDPADLTTQYEILASTTPYSDALHAERFNAVFGLLPGPVTVARADPISYTANGFVWSSPPATMGVGASGAEVWKGSTNYALRGSTISTGAAATAPWVLSAATVTTPTGGAPDGIGDYAEVTSSTNIGGIYQVVPVLSTSTITASSWVRKVSGSGPAGVMASCQSGTASGCTCSRSDGGSCTPAISNVFWCIATATDLTTTPVRMSASTTCTPAVISTAITLLPGENGVSTGTSRFWGAQMEPGLYPTPYIATAGTAVARAATGASVPLPQLGNKWCVSVTGDPQENWNNWTAQKDLWGIGQSGQAGTARIMTAVATQLTVQHWDASAAMRTCNVPVAISGSDPHRITLCNNNGAMTVCADGVQKTCTLSGAGTGLWTTNASTFYLGSYFNTLEFWDGALSNVKICKGATKCSDCR